MELRGRMQVEPVGPVACPSPIEHLLQAFAILDELGVRDYVARQPEAQQLLAAPDVPTSPPAADLASTAGPPALPNERRPPSLRRAKAALQKKQQNEAETRVAHRNNGKNNGNRRKQ